MGLSVSCGFGGDSSGEKDPKEEPKFVDAECTEDSRCKEQCKKLFSLETDLLNKCLKQDVADVSQLNVVVSAMDKGNWNSIKPEPLKILVDFDEDIWVKYADVNIARAKEMLVWVAKNEEIANHLGDEQAPLKAAFASVGGERFREDIRVIEGMKAEVEVNKRRTFFEESVHNQNDTAFEAAHALLKRECNESKACIQKVYCDIGESLVFGKLNTLDLGGDAVASGNELHQSDCI